VQDRIAKNSQGERELSRGRQNLKSRKSWK